MYVFSTWQRRVVAALMICDGNWQTLQPPKPGTRWVQLCDRSSCVDAEHWSRAWMWRRRARAIERRWPAVWGAWLQSDLWRGDWRAALNVKIVDHGPDDDMGNAR